MTATNGYTCVCPFCAQGNQAADVPGNPAEQPDHAVNYVAVNPVGYGDDDAVENAADNQPFVEVVKVVSLRQQDVDRAGLEQRVQAGERRGQA